LLVDIRFC